MPEQSTNPTPSAQNKGGATVPATSDRNLLAAVSYIWIIGVILLFVKKDPFIKFHAKQSVILFLFSLIGFIPLLGWIVWILAVIGMVVGFLMAWQGREYKLPVVYQLSTKIRV